MADLDLLRRRIRPLLAIDDPADAQAVYYALYHTPRRTQVVVHEDNAGLVDGFVAVCQTGQRLFRPTVLFRASGRQAVRELLSRALVLGRPYYVTSPMDLRGAVSEAVRIERPEIVRLYRLDRARFRPDINVMVVEEPSADGAPRFVIRSRGEIAAEAGVNWISPVFADVFVYTAPVARRRGWGKAVLSACSSWVVRSARGPLYVVNEANEESVALATSVGYVDTGHRESAGEGVYLS